MAMSNAERQRRFRERQKEKLRNAGNGPQRTLARMLYDRYVTDGPENMEVSESALPGVIADDIKGVALSEALRLFDSISLTDDGFDKDADPDRDAIHEFLGGAEYCAALEKYYQECSAATLRNKGNCKDKREPMPEPPPIPET